MHIKLSQVPLLYISDGLFCKKQLPSELSTFRPETFSLKKILKDFPRNTCSEKVYTFSQTLFTNFQETELSDI